MRNKPFLLVIDTNIWISFLITKKFSELDKFLFSGKCILLFSEELINEFIEVATRPKFRNYFSSEDIEKIIETMNEFGILIKVKSNINLCRDKKDNFLLSLCVDGNADFLISGEDDLLTIQKIEETSIITFRELLKIL